jgi:hypothetical protein
MKEIWLEKYRPKLLDDVVGNDQIISRLQSLQINGNMPHILLVVCNIYFFLLISLISFSFGGEREFHTGTSWYRENYMYTSTS